MVCEVDGSLLTSRLRVEVEECMCAHVCACLCVRVRACRTGVQCVPGWGVRNDSEPWPGETWWEGRDWRWKEPVHGSAVEGKVVGAGAPSRTKSKEAGGTWLPGKHQTPLWCHHV